MSNYLIRVNLRNTDPSKPQSAVLSLGPSVPWVFPEDPSVDLAAVPLALDISKIDYAPIPSDMLATSEVIKTNAIAEGDPVIFSGLFAQMPGLIRLEPIVRQGIIAMMPDEAITTTLGKPGYLYLADVHVFWWK